MKNCESSASCGCSACAAESSEENTAQSDGCGCGCDHERHEGEELSTKQNIIAIAASVVSGAVGIFAPEGFARTALFLAAILAAGAPIFWRGIKNILRLNFEEASLLTIAVAAAVIIGEAPEAVMVTLLFRVGEMLEDIAVERSRREVEAVTNVIPDNANLLLEDGTTRAVGAKTLGIGDKMRIKSGERVPVDCVVLDGTSSVDSSSLTGESTPREVGAGETLLSGMVNIGGVLTCEAVNTFDNSAASKIVRMVKDSAAKKGGTERMISRFARVYTPIVMLAAVLVAVLPPLLGFGNFTLWVGRSLVFLVASCPCALVIATPLTFFAGIGGASKQGILIKGSKYMEVLAKTKAVVFDKTGTLTTGSLTVDEVYPADGFAKEDVLTLAAVCEYGSNHPVARAVVAAATRKFPIAESCEEITAYGMRATLDGNELLCGSARLMQKFATDISVMPEVSVYVAKNGVCIGAISVFDAPRDDAAGTVRELLELGAARVAMLTGDSAAAAEKAAGIIGITDIRAGLLPGDKVEQFTAIKAETDGTALFVGDGVNDSPVIAAADAGVAAGMSSDAAIEAADVVLLSGKLLSLPQAITIAKRTVRLAKFNIAFALAVKLIVFVLAVFGFTGMWMAVFADVGVTIITVLNATRALRFR